MTTWYDQIGNGNDATQSVATAQPKIYDAATGVVTENGKPAVQWDASVRTRLNVPNLGGASRLDAYFVSRADTSVSNPHFIYPWSGVGSGNHRGLTSVQGSTSTNLYLGYGTPDFYVNGTLRSFTNRNDVYEALLDTQNIVLHENADLTGWAGFVLGRFSNPIFNVTGTFQEMLFFTSDQSANRAAITANINAHFGVYGSHS